MILNFVRKWNKLEKFDDFDDFGGVLCLQKIQLLSVILNMMSIKIRNPEIIEQELETLARESKNSVILFEVLPFLRQFWSWVSLQSDIALSDAIAADAVVRDWVLKGYSLEDALEFMFIKLLEKDEDKNPEIKEALKDLRDLKNRDCN